MKNKYFGDINDYRKYGILRSLTDIRILICWMLTEDDNRTDGKFTDYTGNRNKYRIYDPSLFDVLENCIKNKIRNTSVCEEQMLIPGAGYFTDYLYDSQASRDLYFSKLYSEIKNYDLIFLDPDNGLEVSSKKTGTKGSSKYLYYNEVSRLYEAGCSLLIYQHFPRVNRDTFIIKVSDELKRLTNCPEVLFLRTSSVVFFLIPQHNRLDYFKEKLTSINSVWKNEIIYSDIKPLPL